MQLFPGGVFQQGIALFDTMEQNFLGQRAADLTQSFNSRQLDLVIVVLKQLYQVGNRIFIAQLTAGVGRLISYSWFPVVQFFDQ